MDAAYVAAPPPISCLAISQEAPVPTAVAIAEANSHPSSPVLRYCVVNAHVACNVMAIERPVAAYPMILDRMGIFSAKLLPSFHARIAAPVATAIALMDSMLSFMKATRFLILLSNVSISSNIPLKSSVSFVLPPPPPPDSCPITFSSSNAASISLAAFPAPPAELARSSVASAACSVAFVQELCPESSAMN